MTESPQENTPIVLDDNPLDLKSTWENVVSVRGIKKEKVESIVKTFLDITAFGDSKNWDGENKSIVQKQKQSFIEEDLPHILKGEQRAFREMRFSVREESGAFVLILADNLDNRKVGKEGLKGWLLQSITEREK